MKKKILLIHGWDYRNYTKNGGVDVWTNRSRFVEILRRQFEVITINLPGFCSTPDPDHPWALDDFTDYVGRIIDREQPNAVLGYSFGGAITLHWKKISKNTSVKAFLVSPAVLRRYERNNTRGIQKLLKTILPESFVSVLRDFYLIRVVKNPYYAQATTIMRETYRNIVSIDLRQDLLDITDSLTLIYGEKDSATPSDFVRNILNNTTTRHTLHIITGGGHDIANSHTQELVNIITGDMK